MITAVRQRTCKTCDCPICDGARVGRLCLDCFHQVKHVRNKTNYQANRKRDAAWRERNKIYARARRRAALQCAHAHSKQGENREPKRF